MRTRRRWSARVPSPEANRDRPFPSRRRCGERGSVREPGRVAARGGSRRTAHDAGRGVAGAGPPPPPPADGGERQTGPDSVPHPHASRCGGGGTVSEPHPAGARERPLTPHARELWSTGIIPLTDGERRRIVTMAHHYAALEVDYSFLDYLALAARRFRLPVPGLKTYIRATGHMICSQLCDAAYQAAGVQLFADK